MAVTTTPYGLFMLALGDGEFDFGTDTVKVALVTSSYVADFDVDEFFSDVTNEVSGTGYTAGGTTLTTVAWAYDDASTPRMALLTADPASWTGLTATARAGVVYKSTGTPSTSRLIGYVDFGTDKSYAGDDAQIDFANGVVRVKAG